MHPGVEVVLLSAQDALVSTRERFGAQDQIGVEVQTIPVWRLDFLVVGDCCRFRGGSFPFGEGGTPRTMRPSGSRGQWFGCNLGNCR